MSPNLQLSFWERMGLEEAHREVCLHGVQDLYPGNKVEEYKDQGYCSFTIQVSRTKDTPSTDNKSDSASDAKKIEGADAVIVQIRPKQHSLDLSISQDAISTYRSFAPRVRSLECNLPGQLHAFEMDLVCGTPLSRCLSQCSTFDSSTMTKQVNLIQSFATFIARAWPSHSNATVASRYIRADSPITDTSDLLPSCTGNVGVNIIPKLDKLARELPNSELRDRAAKTRNRMLELKDYPVVLNHGDLNTSNILVDEETWAMQGVVDWAEAELLPFGTCLYGLEQLLGYVDYNEALNPKSDGVEITPVWRYYPDAHRLREIFWIRLCDEAPGIVDRMEDVLLARDLGVFLWYGYAWDEGAIDRVVNEKDDAVEVECLKSFLGVRSDNEGEVSEGGR